MSEGSQRYCGNCGTEIRAGTKFCISCGQQVEGNDSGTEANASFGTVGSDSRGGSFLDQRNVQFGLLGVGTLLVLVMAYFILSYSVALGFLLIVLLALAVLVIRKNRGLQTRHEQRLFDTTHQYKESARRAYEEGKHREIAKDAYEQSRKVYEEANTHYQRWNQQKADERRLVERGRMKRINPNTGRMFTDGRRFRTGDIVIYTRNSGDTFAAVVLSVTPNEVEIEFVGDSLEWAGNIGLNSVIRVAPMELQHPWSQNSDTQDLRLEREQEEELRLEREQEEKELRLEEWLRQKDELSRQKEKLLWYQTAERLNMPWYQTPEFCTPQEEAKFVEREMRLRGEPPLLFNMGSDGDGGTKWEERWIPLELLRAGSPREQFDERFYEEDGKRYWDRERVDPYRRRVSRKYNPLVTLRSIATKLEEPRQWLREKLKDGPTYVSLQEIRNKASDWSYDYCDCRYDWTCSSKDHIVSIFETYQDVLFEGEFVAEYDHETESQYYE